MDVHTIKAGEVWISAMFCKCKIHKLQLLGDTVPYMNHFSSLYFMNKCAWCDYSCLTLISNSRSYPVCNAGIYSIHEICFSILITVILFAENLKLGGLKYTQERFNTDVEK